MTRTSCRWLIAVGLVMSSLVAVRATVVDSSDNFVTLSDVHGPNDINGQSDLVSTALDFGHLGDPNPTLWVRWTWDEIAWSGKNTGDACALFDTDGDGNANHAVCVTVGGNPAVQTPDSPRLYNCTSDSRNDRCAGDTEVGAVLSACSTVIDGGDTIATCRIDMDDVGGGAAVLLNTCSFNSREPNSNPPDCVLEPGMGVTVVKDVSDDAAVTSGFEVTVDGSGVIPGAIVGDGSFFVPLTNGTHSVTEAAVPAGYTLATSTCTSGSPAAFSLSVTGMRSVTCTFVNTPSTGSASVAVTKSFTDTSVDAGTSGLTFTIAVENDGSTELTDVVVTDPVDPALTVTSVSADLGGDCSASAGNAVSCAVPSIPIGQTAIVTVTYAVAEHVEPSTVVNTATVTSTEIATPQPASDSVAVTEDVALAITKAFTADPVAAGTTSNSFTLVVTNGGTSDAENVRVVDTVDDTLDVTGIAISPGGDCSASSGQAVDCTIADLAAAGSATITVTYDVAESASAARVTNTAAVSSDEVATPVTVTTSVGILEAVDLAIVKAFAVDPVAAGSTGQTFSITVTNAGTADAENVTISDTVAAILAVTAVSSATADCAASAGQTIDCAIASLGSGESVTVVVTFDVAESAIPATIVNVAAAQSDEVTTPVTGADSVDVVEDVSFDVVKTFGAASAPAGSTGQTFSIEVTNTGRSDAENVRINDVVDPALTVVGVSSPTAGCSASAGQTVDCSLGTLPAGATATITVEYDIDEGVDPGTVTNTTDVRSDEVTVPITASASTDVTEDVAITATKVFSPPTASAGTGGNSFVLTVTNSGRSNADNVRVIDLVDPALQVTGVSISPSGDCAASAGQTVDCTVSSLGGGRTMTVTVTYSLDAGLTPGPITNSMEVTSDEDSASASSSVDVEANVGFDVSKSFDSAAVVAGSGGHTFTISVTNSETSDATGVTITDDVDDALTVTEVSSASADCAGSSGQRVACSLATLPAGQTATVTVTYDVAATVDATTIVNTATVDANELAAPTTGADSVDVVEDVSLAAIKTFSDATVAAGSTGHTFTLVVSNGGASDADNLTISDVVAADLVVSSITSPRADCSASSGQTISCAVASLAGGDSITVTVGYDVAASAEATTVSNSMTVSSDEATVAASDSIELVEDVVLELTKTFADSSVAAGVVGSTFTMTLTNTGRSDAENVSLTDIVAPELVVSSATSPEADCSASAGQTVDCSAASLAPGASISVTVTYDVDESTAPATLSNTATASSDEDRTSATDELDVVEDVELAVTKTFSPVSAVAGSTGNSFTIAVANSGLSDAENVTITDAVDPRLTVTGVLATPAGDCSATIGNAVDCTVVTLAAGATVTLTVTYDVPSETDTSTISNTAAASSDEVAPVIATHQVDITEHVVLGATKTFGDATVVAGTTDHHFTIAATNGGISTADAVSIVDTVDARFVVTDVSIAPLGNCSASTGNSIDCVISSLGAAQTATVTVTYDVPPETDSGAIANTAAVAADELVTPLSPTDSVDVTEDVSLTATKTFAPDTAVAGSVGNTFTISVLNSGMSDADNVGITDTVDPALTAVSAVIAPSGSCAPVVANIVDCSLGSLGAGASALVTVTYDVPPSTTAGTVPNTADVVSDEVTTPVTGSDSLTVTEDVTLEVTKAFASDPVVAGSTGNSFSIAVANTGISDADGVVITDAVEPGLIVTGASIAPAGDCAATVGNAVSCSVAVLPPGATTTVTVVFDIPEGTDAGSVTNTATAISDEVTTPVTGSDIVEVTEDVALSASKAFAVDPVVAGSTGNTFTIVVTNSGRSDADDVSITDSVDAALSVTAVSISPVGDCSASTDNMVDCTLTSLSAGASATVTVTYDVPEGAAPSTVVNSARVDSDELVAALTPTDELTIDEDVDLIISKKFATAGATAGVGGYSFSVAVTNAGRSDAEDVRITDVVDAALTVVSVTAVGGDCSASSGQMIDCSFATLASGATATVTIGYDVGVAVTTPQTVNNTASATSDEVTTAVTVADSVDVGAVVSFDSEKAFAAASVAAGSTGNTFTISVSNSGPSDASGITIADVVDARLAVTAVSIAPIGDCSASSGQTISCSVGSMAVGESSVVTVTYDVDESVEAGTIANSAEVDSVVPRSATTVTTSVDIVEDVDLSLVKTFTSSSVAAGSTGNSFSIAVINAGLSDAENVVVTDVVDATLTVTAVSIGPAGDCSATVGNRISCTIASLGGGSTSTVSVLYDVDESAVPQTVLNTSAATSDEVSTPVTGSTSIAVDEDVALSIVKSFAPAAVTAGTTGNSFTIAVANSGRSDAENVVITDIVDAALGVTGASVAPAGDCSATVGNRISCTIPVLPAAAGATVTVFYGVVASAPAGLVANTAGVISDEVGVPVEHSSTVDVVRDVVLAVDKSFATSPVVAGTGGHVFSITVRNSGRSDARDVVITDAVDAALTVTGVVASPGVDCSATVGNSISCSLTSLPSRATVSVAVNYAVPASTDTSTIANLAAAVSDDVATPVIGGASVDVVEDVVLATAKEFAGATVIAGTTDNSFTIAVTNSGTSDADNVVISDSVDAALIVTAATINPSGDCSATSGNAVSCTVGALASGSTATVTVTYDVAESVDPTVVINTAASTSDEVSTPATGSATIDVIEDVALSVVKSFDAASVSAGTAGHTFAITVTNTGRSDAENVRIIDAVDPELTVTGVAVAPGGDCAASAGNSIDCTVPRVAAGATVVATVTYEVDTSADPATISNTATATSDEVTTPVAGSATVDTVEDVELSALKAFDAAAVVAGSTGNTFTIAVTNAGASDAENVRVTDDVDAALTVSAASMAPAGDCSATSGNVVSCTIASLAAGATATVTVTYDVDASVDPGVIANTAVVTSDEVTAPVTGVATVDVFEDVVLAVTKAFATPIVVAGTDGQRFEIEVTNSGQSDAENVRITDAVDAALTVSAVEITPTGDCAASVGNDIDCTVASLAPGASTIVTVTFAVPADVPSGTVVNSAAASSDEVPAPVLASTSIAVTRVTDLAADKTTSPDPYLPGGPITYTIVVSNAGPSTATAVHVTELLPAGLTDVAFTTSSGTYDARTGDWTGLSIAPDESATLTVTATTPTSPIGTLINTVVVDVAGDAPDPDDSDNVAVAQNPTNTVTDLSIVKTVDATNPAPGDQVRWTIVVSNDGLGAALDATVSDPITDMVEDVTWTCSASGSVAASCGSPSGTGDIDTVVSLLPGDEVTFVVLASVAAGAVGELANTATVSAAGDPDAADNAATSRSVVREVADLDLSKTTDERSIDLGDTVTYHLTVSNHGPSVARGTTVTDELPAGTTFVAARSPDATCAHTSGVVTCAAGDLDRGDVAVISVDVIVLDGAADTRLVNHASVASTTADPAPANNRDHASVDVGSVAPAEPSASGALPRTGDTGTAHLSSLGVVLVIAGICLRLAGRRRRPLLRS